MTNEATRILGLDPGLRRTGWGVVASEGARLRWIAHGVIAPPETAPFSERLLFLLEAVGEVCAAHDCDEAAIEEVFVNMNPVSTLKLGHARAAVMLAPARHGLSVAEYAPNLIKKAVVGAGHADKTQIAFMAAAACGRGCEGRCRRCAGRGHHPCADAQAGLAHSLEGGGMIGRLRGVLAEVEADYCLIDCAGVGYVVACGARTLGRLPAPGDEATLHIESNWNAESGPRLYGFLTRDERRAFTTLTAIQGVGPKAALSVLDVLPPGELAAAVAREDKAAVARANGVGPKLALRIVTELKGKPLGDASFTPSAPGVHAEIAPLKPSVTGEAVSALLGLGVAEVNARRAVDQALIRLGDEADLSAVIRAALQELGR
jgi:Holliday junction DNA helicase RuvA